MMTGSEFLFFVNCNISILCGPLSSEAHTEDCAPKIKKQKMAFYMDTCYNIHAIVVWFQISSGYEIFRWRIEKLLVLRKHKQSSRFTSETWNMRHDTFQTEHSFSTSSVSTLKLFNIICVLYLKDFKCSSFYYYRIKRP